MPKLKWGSIIAMLGLSGALLSAQVPPTLAARAKAATAILTAQNESGGMDVRCTATVFEKKGKRYHFVSAAHCIGSDDVQKERAADGSKQSFYVTFDETVVKAYFEAKPIYVGYQHRGDDFSVFEVLVKDREGNDVDPKWGPIPLGDEHKEVEGASLINPASPLGLGVQLFRGSISSLYLDRPVILGDINWKGAMLIQMPGTQGGSSGSVLISESQNAIVGFLVGSIGDSITAIPVSRFKEFLKKVSDGSYKWAREPD